MDWGYGFMRQHRQLIAELLSSGASVQVKHAAVVLPIAVSLALPLAARNETELAARRSEARRRCAREDSVGLAQDVRELRDAEQTAAVKRRRLEELEGEVGGSSGREGSDGGDDEGEDEGDADDGESGGGDGSGSEDGRDDEGEPR